MDPSTTEGDMVPSDTNGTGDGHHDRDDPYLIRVKAEFVCTERPSCLSDLGNFNDGASDQARGTNGTHGTSKKRARGEAPRVPTHQKMCPHVIRGRTCPYFVATKEGDNDTTHNNKNKNKRKGKHPKPPSGCKFSHDLAAAMATRPPDVTEILDYCKDRQCPLYTLYGKCRFGVTCRVGSCHLGPDGRNLSLLDNQNKNDNDNDTTNDNNDNDNDNNANNNNTVLNLLSNDVRHQLRRKTFPFRCPKGGAAVDYIRQLPWPDNDNHDNDHDRRNPQLSDLFRRKGTVYVAPLTTVGNLPFRRLCVDYGADVTCGEMAVATQLLDGRPTEWALLKRHVSERHFGVQVAAGHVDQFGRLAELLNNLSLSDDKSENNLSGIDFVDLNVGCPIDVICEKGCGASLMLRDKKLKGGLDAFAKLLKVPFTFKVRTGWDASHPIAHTLVPHLLSSLSNHNNDTAYFGGRLAAVMMHGRSRLQRYSKLADWDYVAKVARLATDVHRGNTDTVDSDPNTTGSHSLQPPPIIGNGDIYSYIDYRDKVLSRPELAPTAMIGRGALIKPWLPTEIKESRHWDISASERLDLLKQFCKYGLEHWGSDQMGIDTTRRFLLEWLSFLYRYVPVGLLERCDDFDTPAMNQRPPLHFCGRSDLETLMASKYCGDWIRISEMLLGKVPDGFQFQPKHKASGYATTTTTSSNNHTSHNSNHSVVKDWSG